MTTLKFLVFAAPVLAGVVAISTAYFAMWLDERAERRKAQRRIGE